MSAPVTVVTGAGGGIGGEVAALLAARGHAVACCDASLPAATAVADRIGGTAFEHDVTDPAGTDAVVAAIVAALGTPTGLVACAGIERTGPSETLPADLVRTVVDVNLLGSMWAAQAVVRAAAPAAPPSIVLVASANGITSSPGQAAYTASKAGVIGLTRALAVDWGRLGVRVNAVAPGVTDTAMSARTLSDPQRRAAMLARIPLARPAQPAEIASAAAFLLSDEAAYITGVVLPVDGGWLARA